MATSSTILRCFYNFYSQIYVNVCNENALHIIANCVYVCICGVYLGASRTMHSQKKKVVNAYVATSA